MTLQELFLYTKFVLSVLMAMAGVVILGSVSTMRDWRSIFKWLTIGAVLLLVGLVLARVTFDKVTTIG